MVKGTDKIDILSVGGKLSPDQCTIAIGIWKQIGCFDTLSDQAHTIKKLREEKVIERTFYNYNDGDHDKIVRLLTQIIDYYRCEFTNGAGVNQIARLTYNRKSGSYTIICKPNNAERLKGWNWRLNTAATNIDKADKIQKDDPTVLPDDSINLVINKICSKNALEDRPELLKRFITAAQDKLIEVSTTLALIESSKKLEEAVADGSDREDKENGSIRNK